MDTPVASLPLILPQPGFICGTVPVPTATDRQSLELVTVQASSMKVVSDSSGSLRYSFLPAEMDLNAVPPNWLKREELGSLNPHLLTNEDTQDRDAEDLCDSCSHHSLARPLPKKCEDLAVHGLAAYGDAIDFIAPASVMKQIFKTPYSKAPISVAIHRIGKTLILNDGPDAVESTSKQSSQSMTVNKDLFEKFVHHSVNAAPAPSDSDADAAPGQLPPEGNPCRAWQFYSGSPAQSSAAEPPYVPEGRPSCTSSASGGSIETGLGESPASWVPKRRGFGSKKRDKHGRALAQPKASSRSVGPISQLELGRSRCASEEGRGQAAGAVQDEPLSSDGEEGAGEKGASGRNRERFLRVLFWQFRELQMLLGSDLLLFGNDQHKAVSLYLMEVDRPSSPLPWLDAWLDCLMAAVPEVAVCYHKAGVVQGYELLKTDDLCLLKGVAADGTISFHPQVVHANAAAVLRFLQHNCTSDPGAYWLVKNAGEDLLQLFDLSTIADVPNESEASEEEAQPLRSSNTPQGSQRYEQALAVLIYRLALQLARSTCSGDQRRSGQLLMQCLALMEDKNGPELVAAAHERMARLCCVPSIRPLLLEPHFLLEPPPSNQLPWAKEGTPAESLDAQKSAQLAGNRDRCATLRSSSTSESVSPLSADGKERTGTRTQVQTEALPFRVGSAGQVQQVIDGEAGGSTLSEGAPGGTGLGDESGILDRSPMHASPAAVSWKTGQEGVESEHPSRQDVSTASSSAQLSEEAIQRHLSAAHHFSQAIKALREELTMLSTKTPKRRPAKPDLRGESEVGPGTVGGGHSGCSCKGARHEGRVARTAGKLRALLGSLAASYLEMGRAYEGDGQLARALKAAEVAAMVGGCLKEDDSGRGAALPSSFPEGQQQSPQPGKETAGTGAHLQKESPQLESPFPGPANTEIQRKERTGGRHQNPQPAPIPSPGFWGSLWVFVGDLHVQLQQQWSEESLLAQQAALLSGAPRLHEAVVEELERRAKGRGAGEGGRVGAGSSSSSSGGVGTSETRARGRRESAAKKGGRGATLTSASDADLLCFGRPLSLDFDVNLTAAAESYRKAIAVLEADAGGQQGGSEWELAHRRLGWTANELGRRRLEEGDISAAGQWFRGALASFVAVKDTGNAVLVHCNMGHARRGQAEAMAADGGTREQTAAGDRLKQIRIAHTCRCYQQALSHYIAARSELLSLGEAEAQRSLRGLWNEAHTQLAHTYLRFGMFLAAATGRAREQDREVTTLVVASRKNGVPLRGRPQALEVEPAPSDLLTKALHLYEFLGPAREQEAAYAHCQLAALFRDRCLRLRPSPEVAVPVSPAVGQRHEDARWKRCAALAELHWQRALEVYRAESHPDMYIQIGIERSALGLKCAPKSRPSMVVEAALSGLEGIPPLCQLSRSTRDCTNEGNRDGLQNPSKETMAALKIHLESVVRELLQVHVSFFKHKTSLDDDVTAAAKETVSKFKIMYKELLQLGSTPNKDSQEIGRVLRRMLDERP